jgi:D,D-heptose 1,7-bisphosphate phosphatase
MTSARPHFQTLPPDSNPLPKSALNSLSCRRMTDISRAIDNDAPLRRRPAVFFDRDGTLIVDPGYVHRVEDLVFVPGAVAAIKCLNDLGYYVFIATNQSGIARGYFTERDVQALHAELQDRLRDAGAHVDDIRYCPDHPDGTVERYRRSSDWRKPQPGMLLDLMRCWPVDRELSFAVGDRETDVAAGEAAGLRSLLFPGGNLDEFLAPHIAGRRMG